MYKIKVNVEITESGNEVIKNNYETDCDDFDYHLSQCSKEEYGHRYINGINIKSIWQNNPDRPKEK